MLEKTMKIYKIGFCDKCKTKNDKYWFLQYSEHVKEQRFRLMLFIDDKNCTDIFYKEIVNYFSSLDLMGCTELWVYLSSSNVFANIEINAKCKFFHSGRKHIYGIENINNKIEKIDKKLLEGGPKWKVISMLFSGDDNWRNYMTKLQTNENIDIYSSAFLEYGGSTDCLEILSVDELVMWLDSILIDTYQDKLNDLIFGNKICILWPSIIKIPEIDSNKIVSLFVDYKKIQMNQKMLNLLICGIHTYMKQPIEKIEQHHSSFLELIGKVNVDFTNYFSKKNLKEFQWQMITVNNYLQTIGDSMCDNMEKMIDPEHPFYALSDKFSMTKTMRTKISNKRIVKQLNQFMKFNPPRFSIDVNKEDVKMVRSINELMSSISLSNWVEEIDDGSCLGLLLNVVPYGSKNCDGALFHSYVKASCTLLPAKFYLGAMLHYDNFHKLLSKRVILKARAIGEGNFVLPLYITKKHWKCSRAWIEPLLGMILTSHPAGFIKRHLQFIYLIVLNLCGDVIGDFSEKLATNFLSVWRVGVEISNEFKFTRGFKKYVEKVVFDQQNYAPNKEYDIFRILGQSLTVEPSPIMKSFYRVLFESAIAECITSNIFASKFVHCKKEWIIARILAKDQIWLEKGFEYIENNTMVIPYFWLAINFSNLMNDMFKDNKNYFKFVKKMDQNYGLLPKYDMNILYKKIKQMDADKFNSGKLSIYDLCNMIGIMTKSEYNKFIDRVIERIAYKTNNSIRKCSAYEYP
jgi:hypothetical protein